MISRKEKYKKKNLSKRLKLLIGTLFLGIVIGSSLNIAFANQDIQSMLTNWFDNQKTNSIELIESAVTTEKEKQLQRVKKQVEKEVSNAERELKQFTNKEKKQRVKTIKKYANELIKGMETDTSEDQTEITNELDSIVEKAINQMNNVKSTATPTQPEADEPTDNKPEIVEQSIAKPTNEPAEDSEVPKKKDEE